MGGPLTQASQTAESFADISLLLLHECVADEELRRLRDNVSRLAKALDGAVGARRQRRETTTIARRAATLAQELRQHQALVGQLSAAWKAMYEWHSYLRDLRELAQAVQHWREALAQRSRQEGAVFDQMERLAWRTLGEGLLLLDMYQQGLGLLMEAASEPAPPAPSSPPLWWQTLLWRWQRWWRGDKVRH
ncbi:MAG: hypothetical protein PHX60_13795 [Giesbergeria sp.]|uniref:hypothetical protein n=1 Tax=Giesbergeria sp. TaxID=2818473 RepID=UPI002609D8D3|nr:hypothetical protein [Giesbergeria sp.]MDD2610734.1 hypothetical protein [Giesbergeria sp.]